MPEYFLGSIVNSLQVLGNCVCVCVCVCVLAHNYHTAGKLPYMLSIVMRDSGNPAELYLLGYWFPGRP